MTERIDAAVEVFRHFLEEMVHKHGDDPREDKTSFFAYAPHVLQAIGLALGARRVVLVDRHGGKVVSTMEEKIEPEEEHRHLGKAVA